MMRKLAFLLVVPWLLMAASCPRVIDPNAAPGVEAVQADPSFQLAQAITAYTNATDRVARLVEAGIIDPDSQTAHRLNDLSHEAYDALAAAQQAYVLFASDGVPLTGFDGSLEQSAAALQAIAIILAALED